MQYLTDTKQVLKLLKQVKEERGLSLDNIVDLTEQNGSPVSKTTVSRVFRDGSENEANTFRYDTTLRPICDALLDIETIETDDDIDTKAYKSILKLKKDLLTEYSGQIKELKEELSTIKEHEKAKYGDRLEKETKHFINSLDFLKAQIQLKDERIDALLATTTELMQTNNSLLKQLMNCPLREGGVSDGNN